MEKEKETKDIASLKILFPSNMVAPLLIKNHYKRNNKDYGKTVEGLMNIINDENEDKKNIVLLSIMFGPGSPSPRDLPTIIQSYRENNDNLSDTQKALGRSPQKTKIKRRSTGCTGFLCGSNPTQDGGARRKKTRRKAVRRKSVRRKTVCRKTVRRKSVRRKAVRRKTVRRKAVRRNKKKTKRNYSRLK